MIEKIKQNKEIFYSIVLIVIPVTVLFSFAIIYSQKAVTEISDTNIVQKEDPTIVFNDVLIEAKAAIVKDLNTGEILYSKNSELPLPLASLTKVLTALTFEINSQKEIVNISLDNLKEEGDSLLYPGEQFHKKDLIDFALITSSNDAASALAASAIGSLITPQNTFVTEMNRVARSIGMKNSYFYNETGLDSDRTTAGAHGTASDVATLFEYVLKNYPDILDSTSKSSAKIKSINGFVHYATNTNSIVNELPNLVASKTGFTDIAGGNLAVVIDPALNRPIVIIVLGSSEEGRFRDVKTLANKTEEFFDKSSI